MVTRVRTPDPGGPFHEQPPRRGNEHLPSGSEMISPELGNCDPTFSSRHCDGTNRQERNGESLQCGEVRNGSQLRSCTSRRLWREPLWLDSVSSLVVLSSSQHQACHRGRCRSAPCLTIAYWQGRVVLLMRPFRRPFCPVSTLNRPPRIHLDRTALNGSYLRLASLQSTSFANSNSSTIHMTSIVCPLSKPRERMFAVHSDFHQAK